MLYLHVEIRVNRPSYAMREMRGFFLLEISADRCLVSTRSGCGVA